MIWYALWFFRGTTEPPVLDAKHPLRYAFTRYGSHAARHPVITLLISVATAAVLIYPFPFLYTNNFTNGASNLPHHVWTSAQPYEGDPNTRADVVMRSIWVHSSYMKALAPEVLQSALEIQDHLLGTTKNFNPRRPPGQILDPNPRGDLTVDMRDRYHAVNGLSNSSWFFHSPLQYWSCASERIASDEDIISTINAGARQATSVNVTLRHSIVFSGKRFENHRLIAADALVITLVHMLDSPVGRQWERKAQQMALQGSDKWRLYLADIRNSASTLYEFRFQPLSFQDDVFLTIAYTLASLYFILSLSKLRALKSRLGLILAVISQIVVSTVSSFTICAIFKIDLSKIPREAYPLVILTVGLENIFRFINAVIMTPPESPTAARISEALGQTGHIALAGVTQNLFILWFLSKMVSPQIKAFCSFAAIALTFDFFYLITFFTGVLSIELRRTELSDALTRLAVRSRRNSFSGAENRRTWVDALLHGEAPLSTRVAGTIVMIGFVVIAQWHFFDNESFYRTAIRVMHLVKAEPQPPRSTQISTLSVDINQARTPTAWLRLQDHETAHEVIKIVKPNGNSYLARVYDPLIFVLSGSDRTPNKSGVRPFLPAAYDFVKHQSTLFVIVITICVAAVSLLMNYLLWDDMPEPDSEDRQEEEKLISIKTLNRGHSLDVVLITASPDGVIATVGLDRLVRIWDVRKGIYSYIVQDPEVNVDPFPVLAIAIDSDSNWLALLCASNRVYLWNIPERRWGSTIEVDVKSRRPVAFFFGYDKFDLINTLLVTRANGVMTELHVDSEACENEDIEICHSSLVCIKKQFEKSMGGCKQQLRVITSSRRGCVHIATKSETGGWVSRGVNLPGTSDDEVIPSIASLPLLSSFLAVRSQTVDLVSTDTHGVTHTFQTQPMKKNSLRCFHSSHRRPQCDSMGLAFLALAYTDAETGNCIIQIYLPQRDGDTICFRDPSTTTSHSQKCCFWQHTVMTRHEVEDPGDWEALQVGYVVGVRRKQAGKRLQDITAQSATFPVSSLRRRGASSKRTGARDAPREGGDAREVWCISVNGELKSAPLCDPSEGSENLLIGELGPLEKIGRRSIAVGLGNVIKVISIGNEKYGDQEGSEDDMAFASMKAASSRRKRQHWALRKSSS